MDNGTSIFLRHNLVDGQLDPVLDIKEVTGYN